MRVAAFARSAGALAFAGVLCTATAAPALAEEVKLSGQMSGKNEVPANDSAASGKADATFDTATRKLTWTVVYSGLTGPAAGAHFHGPAETGKNAGIVLPFGSPVSPINGSSTLSETQAADLLAGKWYANVHTAKHPGGEIRGQMLR